MPERENENSRYEEPPASRLIRHDYLNEYLPILMLLEDGKPITLLPRSFSERYSEISFDVNEEEREIITELDRLAVEVKELLSEPQLDKAKLANIFVQIGKLCHRDDWVNYTKRVFKE